MLVGKKSREPYAAEIFHLKREVNQGGRWWDLRCPLAPSSVFFGFFWRIVNRVVWFILFDWPCPSGLLPVSWFQWPFLFLSSVKSIRSEEHMFKICSYFRWNSLPSVPKEGVLFILGPCEVHFLSLVSGESDRVPKESHFFLLQSLWWETRVDCSTGWKMSLKRECRNIIFAPSSSVYVRVPDFASVLVLLFTKQDISSLIVQQRRAAAEMRTWVLAVSKKSSWKALLCASSSNMQLNQVLLSSRTGNFQRTEGFGARLAVNQSVSSSLEEIGSRE